MKRIFILSLLIYGAVAALAQPCGLNDTLYINNNTSPVFNFEVFNIFNDDLSDPDQGICGIEIYFLHQFVDNLELAVTSPAGQTVELIGPNTSEQFSFTPAARWRITFVQCGDIAMPDPGFLPQWDNDQPNNFVTGGQYTGSYYPYQGCLEDFNIGPVNGTWNIEVTNDPSNFPGAILGFRLLFCDERGLDCCFAASGNLSSNDDILTCVGDTSLTFDIDPTFNGTPPDSSEYGYTYLIAEDSILLEYDSIPDLSSRPPGLYQICGISYKREDRDSFPMPDGMVTIDSIRDNLDGLEPEFCGEVTDTCIWVEILPLPDTTFLTSSICEGDSIMVGDSIIYTGGNHFITLPSFANCDSIVALDLSIIPIPEVSLQDTICEGDSVLVGDSIYTETGIYTDTLISSQMCDSIVSLDLTVLPPIVVNVSAAICQGESYTVGDSVLTEAGFFEITLTSLLGCDSLVQLNLLVVETEAVISTPDTLSCANPEVMLDGSGSTPAGMLNYQWLDAAETPLGNTPTLATTEAGLFILEVSREENGITCFNRDTIEVIADTIPPVADAGPADTINCFDPILDIGGNSTSTGPEFSYSWSTSNGNISGAVNDAITQVDDAGIYTLIVTDTLNGCADSSSVIIEKDTLNPIANAGPDTTLTCSRQSLMLDGSSSSQGAEFVYDWISTDGEVPVDPATTNPTVSIGGTYRLMVTNEDNGCVDSSFITVSYDTLAPDVNIEMPDTLNCEQTTVVLSGNFSDAGSAPDFSWQVSNGGNIISDEESLMPIVDAPGTYTLVLVNTETGCTDSTSIEVVQQLSSVAADAGAPDTLTCADPVLALDGSASTMGPGITYNWSSPNGHFTSDSSGVMVNIDAPGIYELIVLDPLTQCADTSSVAIAQDTVAPLAIAGPGRTLSCDSICITLDGTASSSGPDYDYNWWEVTQGTIISAGTLTPEVCEQGTYMLLVLDVNNGCLDTSFVQVDIDTLSPEVTIAPADLLNCTLQEQELDATASESGPGFSLEWTTNNGGVIAQGEDSLTPTITAAGDYTLTITNDSTGCMNAATAIVQDTINQLQAGIAPAGPLTCAVDQLTLDTLNSSAGSDLQYCWSANDGLILGDSLGNSVSIGAAGTYFLTVKDTFTFCTVLDSIDIQIDTLPPLAEAGDGFELNCSILQDTLSAEGSSTASNISYQWNGPCVFSGENTNAAVVDCPGTYYLEVTNTDNACVSIDSVQVTQDENIPVADLGEGAYVLNCDSLAVTIDAGNSSQGSLYTYEWDGPGILSGANTLFPLIGQPGLYTLTITDTVNTCQSTATATVEQDTITPVADAGEFDVLTCDSLVVEIGGFETSMGGAYVYLWTSGNGSFVTSTEQAFVQVDGAGDYVLEVVDTINGCRDTSMTTVFDSTDPPEVDAGPDAVLDCATPTATLGDANAPTSANLTYTWTGPCLNSSPDSTTVEVDCDGTYLLSVFDSASGCANSDTVIVSTDAGLPLAIIPDSLYLSCENGSVVIDASNSEGAFFNWFFNTNPIPLAGLMPTVDSTGTYTLVAQNANQDCADTARVVVLVDCTPLASIVTPQTLTCDVTTVILDGSASTIGDSIVYNWVTPSAGCIVGGQGTPTLEARCGGSYSLIVTNTSVGLSDTTSVTISTDTIPPFAEAGPTDMLTCDEPVAILDGSGSTQGAGIGYTWTQLENEFFYNDSLQATIFEDGTYFLTVLDSLTGCVDEDVVIISSSDDLPDISFNSNVIPCLEETFWLEATVEPPGPDYSFSWGADNVILSDLDSSAVLLDTSGFFTLTVVNPDNNCTVYRNINVIQQQCIPCLEAMPYDSLTCQVDTVELSAFFCEPCEGCTVQWSSTNGIFLTDTDSLEVLVGAPGLYTITAFDTLGFSEAISMEVVENTILPPANAGPDQQLECDIPVVSIGTALTTDSIYTFNWTASSGDTIALDSLPQIDINFPDTFTLEVTNLITGCTTTDEVVVSTNTVPPVADAGDTTLITCNTTTVALDGSGSAFGNNITYQWEGPENSTIAGQSSFNPVVNQAGWYLLTVTDTLTGCFARDSVLVELDAAVPPVPELQDTALNCATDVIIISGEVPPGDQYSFCWNRLDNNGNPAPPCVEMLDIAVSIPGTYQFEVVNNNNNCSNSTTVTIGENHELPIVNAGPDLQLPCALDSLMLTGSAAPDTAVFSYSWSAIGGSSIGNADSATPSIYNADIYLLTATNLLNQCSATDTIEVLLDDEAPTADAGPDSTLTCNRTALRLQASQETASGQSSITWNSPDGEILLDETSLMPLIGAAGMYIISVTDPVNGCSAQDTAFVTELTQTPTAAILDSPLQLDCNRDSVFLDGTLSMDVGGAGLLYNWRRPPFGVIGEDSTITIGNTGNYLLVVTDALNGCKDSLEIMIGSDYSTPEAAIAMPSIINCDRDSVLLDGSNSTTGPEISYQWINPANDTLPENGIMINTAIPGEYELLVINQDNGCFETAFTTVEADTLTPEVNILPPVPLDCMIRESRLDGSSSSSGPGYDYSWSTGPTGGVILEGQDTSIARAGAPGWYLLEVLNTENGCSGQDSVEVMELAAPINTVIIDTLPPSCIGRTDGMIEVDSVAGGTPPYLYSLDAGAFSPQASFNNLPAGSYNLGVEDSNGCQWENSLSIPEADTLSINLEADATIHIGQRDTLLAEVSTTSWDSIWWWPTDGFPLANNPLSYVVSPQISTVYQVWVSTGEGCVATDHVRIKVDQQYRIYAPTIFSPDGNGNNDFYTIYAGADVVEVRLLQIYDRWGNQVFEQANFPPNEPSLGWDGTLNGSPMDPAVFAFHAEVVYKGGEIEIFKGDLVLMR